MKIRSLSPLTSFGLGLLGLIQFAPAARADIRWVETGGFVPTATVVAVPRTYLVPASTTVMTSSYLPTSTTANVYVDSPITYVPSSYVTSSYVDYVPARPAYRAFRPRRYYERAYLATPRTLVPTYYLTNAVSTGLVATSAAGLCCETPCCADANAPASPAPAAAPAPASKVVPRETRTTGDLDERQPKAIDSSVAGGGTDRASETARPARDERLDSAGANTEAATASPRTALPNSGVPRDARSSAVDPLEPAPRPALTESAKPADPKTAPAPAPTATSTRPPVSGVEVAKPAPSRLTVPNPAAVVPPPAPAPDTLLPDPEPTPPLGDPAPIKPKDEIQRRDAMKPVVPSPSVESRSRSTRSILQGKIVSAETRNDEEGVEVIVSDASGRHDDRTTRTDAFGKFAITLPDGDWTIKLTMRSGRRLMVGRGEIKVASGRIIDMYGRDLTNLVIQR